MLLWNAFQTWNLQNLQQARGKDRKALQLNNALEAEVNVADVLTRAGCREVHMRKRIYVMQDGHHREIDVVALTDRILAVEVKNWAGSIWRSADNRWFQLPPRQERALEFGDIFEEVEHKANGLRRHLENDHKIKLPDQAVMPVIVFTNRSAKLDPRTVANMKGVFTLEFFEAYAKSVCAQTWGQWIMSFVPYWGHAGDMLPEVKARVAKALATMKTWDTLVLHNGTVIHGDVKAVDAPNAHLAYERHHLIGLTVSWASSGVWGLFTAAVAGSAGIVRLELTEHKRRAKKKELKQRDPDGNISFNIRMDKRDMALNDRIVFKRAGSPHTEMISFAQIKSIEMSQHIRER
jgi:hypothetical protein